MGLVELSKASAACCRKRHGVCNGDYYHRNTYFFQAPPTPPVRAIRKPALSGVTNGRGPTVEKSITPPGPTDGRGAAAVETPDAKVAEEAVVGDGAYTIPEFVRTGIGTPTSPILGSKLKGIPKLLAFLRISVPGVMGD